MNIEKSTKIILICRFIDILHCISHKNMICMTLSNIECRLQKQSLALMKVKKKNQLIQSHKNRFSHIQPLRKSFWYKKHFCQKLIISFHINIHRTLPIFVFTAKVSFVKYLSKLSILTSIHLCTLHIQYHKVYQNICLFLYKYLKLILG